MVDITFLTLFLESCGADDNDISKTLLSSWTSNLHFEGPETTCSSPLYIPLLSPGDLKVCYFMYRQTYLPGSNNVFFCNNY